MSANNMYFARAFKGMWYGWATNAEEAVGDEGKPARQLRKSDAIIADSLERLEEKLDAEYGYAEYGITTQARLAKDGFPIEVLE